MCEGLAIHYLHLSTDTIIISSVRSRRCVGAGPCGPYNLSVFVTNHKSSPNSTRGQEQKDTRTSKPAKREQVFDNYNMAWAAQLHTVVSVDRGNAYFVWFVFDRLHDGHVSGCAMRNLFCISTDLCPFTARRLIRSCCYIMSSNLKNSGFCKSIVQC